ncbi:hypothetical protein LA080_010578 [Diaporthe eres]|nr:hypothetical protein LA080_010578 [Diaporthe eres]
MEEIIASPKLQSILISISEPSPLAQALPHSLVFWSQRFLHLSQDNTLQAWRRPYGVGWGVINEHRVLPLDSSISNLLAITLNPGTNIVLFPVYTVEREVEVVNAALSLEAWLVKASAPQQAATQQPVLAVVEDTESPVDAEAFDKTLLKPGDGDRTVLLV